jgi:hypothetical protein
MKAIQTDCDLLVAFTRREMIMKTRILLVVALALVMAGILSVAPAAAGDAVVPFRATYTMHPRIVGATPDGCNIQELPGEGQATHLGLSTFYSDAVACFATLTQSGDMLFTAANGDELHGSFEGSLDFYAPGYVRFWGSYSITDGTGRFEGVTGTGSYEGTAELVPDGEGILNLEGTLTK